LNAILPQLIDRLLNIHHYLNLQVGNIATFPIIALSADRPRSPDTSANGRSHAPVVPISKFPDIFIAKAKSLRV
jgi:hypothetical protein